MAELGAYYITIMPSMKGFSSAVNKELGGLGKSGGKDYSGGFMSVLKGSALGTVLGNLATKAGSSIMGGLRTGIGRLDTIQNFPKVMKALGYETKDAEKSIKLIMERLDGLPTATQDIVTFTQSIADSTGDLDLATKAALGFNDMMLANGASAAEVSQAQGVLNRVLGKGNATVAQWQSIQSVMPAQLAAVARELGGESMSVEELRDQLNDGTISWNDFLGAVVKLDQEGSGAMASFEEQARANSHGIGTALENIPNRIGAGWAAILEAIGREDISAVIDKMSYGVKGGMTRIGEAITDLKKSLSETDAFKNLQTIMKAISDRMGDFGEVVDGAIQAAIPILTDLIDDALQWLVDHGEEIGGFVDGVATSFGSLAEVVGGALKDALPIAQDLVSGVFLWLVDNGDLLVAVIGGIAGAMGSFAAAQAAVTVVSGVATAIGALGEVLPMVTKLADIPSVFALVAETGGPLAGLFGGLSTALGFLAANPAVLAVAAIGSIVGALAAWVLTTEEGKQAWDDFCKAVGKLVEGLKRDFENAFGQIKQNIEDNKVQWQQFKTNLAISAEESRQAFEDFCKDVESKIANDLKSGLDDFKEQWKESCDKTSKWVSDLRSNVRDKFEKIYSTVAKVVGDLWKFLTAKWDEIKTDTITKFDEIKNAIKKAIQWAYDKVEPIIEKIKGLLDFDWSLPAPSLPHITWDWTDVGGIVSIPTFSIEWYGDGGVFDSAAVIGIGERGREAALPLNDATYREIARGISGQMGAGGGDGGITIEKLADTIIIRETADVDEVMDRINTITRRERGAAA